MVCCNLIAIAIHVNSYNATILSVFYNITLNLSLSVTKQFYHIWIAIHVKIFSHTLA